MSETTKRDTLAQRIRAKLAASQPAAIARYRVLLTDDVQDDQQVDEISALLTVLEKSVDELAEDQALVARAKHLVATIKQGRGLKDQITRATAAVDDFSRERLKTIDALNEKLNGLVRERDGLQQTEQAACNACEALKKLKLENPDLLADFATVEVKDL